MHPETDLGAALWLPLAMWLVMGIAMLVYVVLDGYDLGVGILLRDASTTDRDRMIASIGPFWDANETWLVLGIGVLLTAFPRAHGEILGALYLPVAAMLLGLILRGVAFDFRVKGRAQHRQRWDFLFHAGSLLASFAQGVMLGRYVTGFADTALAWAFAVFVGVCVVGGYGLLGAGWLIAKTDGALQQQAVDWARRCLLLTAAGIATITVATPLANPYIFARWFAFPAVVLLMPLPLTAAGLFGLVAVWLRRPQVLAAPNCWLPFAATAAIMLLAFCGLAYSLIPYLIVGRMTVWQGAASPAALQMIFAGVVVVLPLIIGYTVFSYWVFRGKAKPLLYH